MHRNVLCISALYHVFAACWVYDSFPLCNTIPELQTLPAAGYCNDIYSFNPSTNMWTPLSSNQISPPTSTPSPRYSMGFATSPDGILYVFGGFNPWNTGDEAFKCRVLKVDIINFQAFSPMRDYVPCPRAVETLVVSRFSRPHV
jgi:hypothetical protein